jgi:Fe-Mn family superoxide dismutase
MKKAFFLLSILTTILFLSSCNKKKLIEVVDVPLPSSTVEKFVVGNPDDVKAIDGSFQMDKLPFAYTALTPAISTLAMELHYSKHYLSYTNNLNKALVGSKLENLTIEEVLAKLDLNDPVIRINAGGYYNHSLFWKCLSTKGATEPKDTLAGSITKKFGSFSNFTSLFKSEATKLNSSGWVWLIVDRFGELQVVSTLNQDNPLMRNAPIQGKPILAIDFWEHAYYLDYQNKKSSYSDAIFNSIDWEKVKKNYEATFK